MKQTNEKHVITQDRKPSKPHPCQNVKTSFSLASTGAFSLFWQKLKPEEETAG